MFVLENWLRKKGLGKNPVSEIHPTNHISSHTSCVSDKNVIYSSFFASEIDPR